MLWVGNRPQIRNATEPVAGARTVTGTLPDSVSSALDSAFPDRTVMDVSDTGPSWNDRNRTVEVQFDTGDSAFLKVAMDGDGSRIARERAVIQFVRAHCDVSAPRILASAPRATVPYLAMAPIEGVAFHVPWGGWSVDERAEGIRRVGSALAAVNDCAFEHHGHIVGGDADGLPLDTGPWTDVLKGRIGAKRAIASSDRFDEFFDEVLSAVESNRSLLDDAPATLVHGDPAMPNLFVRDGGMGLIDWELSHVGDPAWDLHIARTQLLEARDLDAESRFADALHDGYRDYAGSLPSGFERRRLVYEAVDLLLFAGFFEKMVEWQDKSTAEYASWLESEMRRRIDAIR